MSRKYSLFCVFFGLLMILAACQVKTNPTPVSQIISDDTGTPWATPTTVSTGTAAPTETLPPLPSLPATPTTAPPVPSPTLASHQISPENAANLSLLYRLGKGVLWCLPVYSPDGSHLAVFSSIGVQIYDAHTYAEQLHFATPSGASAAAYSPDGSILAGIIHNQVNLWEAETGTLLRQFEVPESTGVGMNLEFSPDGQWIAASFSDNLLRVWPVEGGDPLFTLPDIDFLYSSDSEDLVTIHTSSDTSSKVVLYSATKGFRTQEWVGENAIFLSEKQLAIEADGVVRIVEVPALRASATFNGSHAAISADSARMALVSMGRVEIWDIASSNRVQTLSGEFTTIENLHFSPDGQILAGISRHLEDDSSGPDSLVMWQVSDGTIITTTRLTGFPQGYVFSPDSARILLSNRLGIQVLDAHTGSLINAFTNYRGPVAGVAISPDGNLVAAAYGEPVFSVQLWQVGAGSTWKLFEDVAENGGSYAHLDLAFSPDGQTVALRGDLWNLSTGDRLNALETTMVADHSFWASSIAFSPLDNSLATGSFDGYLAVWDVSTAQLRQKINGALGEVISLAYSPDGNILTAITGYPDFGFWAWQMPSGELLFSHTGEEQQFRYVLVSPDSQWIATLSSADEFGTNGYVRLWSASDGQMLFQADVDQASSMAFSPDGQLLAIGCYDGTIRLRSVKDGSLLAEFTAHNSFVSGVAFSPDGQYLASSSDDGTVAVWNVP